MEDRRYEIGHGCPECGARIGVLNTTLTEAFRIRYIGCKFCGWRPPENKRLVPLIHAPPQSPRLVMRRLRMRRGH